MAKLKQNTLDASTTGLGFVHTINTNLGETVVAFNREVELEDGTLVNVEGITPNKMKTVLNSKMREGEQNITFKTPGEDYLVNNEVAIKGVCQAYNTSVDNSINHIETHTLPTKLTYTVGEELDLTGMTVIAVEEDGDTFEVTNYTVDIAGRPLTLEDTTADVSYAGEHVYFTITVHE